MKLFAEQPLTSISAKSTPKHRELAPARGILRRHTTPSASGNEWPLIEPEQKNYDNEDYWKYSIPNPSHSGSRSRRDSASSFTAPSVLSAGVSFADQGSVIHRTSVPDLRLQRARSLPNQIKGRVDIHPYLLPASTSKTLGNRMVWDMRLPPHASYLVSPSLPGYPPPLRTPFFIPANLNAPVSYPGVSTMRLRLILPPPQVPSPGNNSSSSLSNWEVIVQASNHNTVTFGDLLNGIWLFLDQPVSIPVKSRIFSAYAMSQRKRIDFLGASTGFGGLVDDAELYEENMMCRSEEMGDYVPGMMSLICSLPG